MFLVPRSSYCIYSNQHAGSGITRTSGAAAALAASLHNLTALRILDLSGAHLLDVFRSCSHPHPDNDIAGFSGQSPRSHLPDEVAAAFAPFLPSLARLHDLESLNLSGLKYSPRFFEDVTSAAPLQFAANALTFRRDFTMRVQAVDCSIRFCT